MITCIRVQKKGVEGGQVKKEGGVWGGGGGGQRRSSGRMGKPLITFLL